MKEISYTSWQNFLSDVYVSMSLQLRHKDDTDYYRVYASDGVLFYSINLKKGTTDATDFESNYKALSNLPPVSFIAEEDTQKKTGGAYRVDCWHIMSIPASIGWTDYDFKYPIPIAILNASWNSKSANAGDKVEFISGPDTIIGAITTDVAVNDTFITVQQSVIDNIKVGYSVKLYKDATTNQEMNRVVSIDKVNLKIEIETKSASLFLAADPTYVKISVVMISGIDPDGAQNKGLVLDGSGPVVLGEGKIGASHIPKNIVNRVRYYNADGVSGKQFHPRVEYLY